MPPPNVIELPDGTDIPIVYEDRSVLVLDKPAGWLVAPDEWVNTRRNLTLAVRSSLENGEWWARSRNLRFLRFVHRLDAETSGLLLCVKSPGALPAYSRLFEDRAMHKIYWAVVVGAVPATEWTRTDPIESDPNAQGRFRVGEGEGKEAETSFKVLGSTDRLTLLECSPKTGRTHQIRLHLRASGCPLLGDDLYGQPDVRGMALRAVGLEYIDPFQRRPVKIRAPRERFCQHFGIQPASAYAGSDKRPADGKKRL